MSNKKKIKAAATSQQSLTNAIEAWGKHDTEHRNALLIITDRTPGSEQLRIATSYAGKPLTLSEAVCAVLETTDDKNMVGDILRAAIHKYMLRSQQREAEAAQKEAESGQKDAEPSEPTAEPQPTTTESNE